MPGKLKLAFWVLIAIMACALPAAASEFSADVMISAGGQQMPSKLYIKGEMQRMEMTTPGGQMINIVDFKTGNMLTLMPAQKMYIEHKSLDDASLRQIQEFRDGKPGKAKKIGSEKVAGYKTDVYQLTDPESGQAKIWYAPKLKYPVKTEGQGPMGKHSMTLSNIKEGGVAAGVFKVPAGYQKLQMPKGMPRGGMGGGMGGGGARGGVGQ
ncbi:hypothetical protein AAU61_09165 [Desulfocarbo indianensis]|nr:hypothetical protein AAU61_09165 [Desulfocarbo indianensis]